MTPADFQAVSVHAPTAPALPLVCDSPHSGERYPADFGAVASLSCAVDIVSELAGADGDWRREMENSFGDLQQAAGGDDDLLALMAKLKADGTPIPRLFQWCGTEDFLYEQNQRFLAKAAELGVVVDYSEGPGGHTWDKWDEQIQNVLAWLAIGE